MYIIDNKKSNIIFLKKSVNILTIDTYKKHLQSNIIRYLFKNIIYINIKQKNNDVVYLLTEKSS